MRGSEKVTFGLVVGNRDVFPRELARKGKAEMLRRLEALGHGVISVSETDTQDGVVESLEDAQRCSDLFRAHGSEIDGILVSLPNFGDERSIADAIRRSDLRVPVFVHAWQDELPSLSQELRRDAFCGKFSVCNNLSQYGIAYTLGRSHVTDPASQTFADEIGRFARTCRIVKGLRTARIGSLGARTTPFKTVRYSEKLLEASGISVESKSLMETVNEVRRLGDDDSRVRSKLKALRAHTPKADEAPPDALAVSAKLAVVLEDWVAECRLDAFALQCWPAMQDAIRVFPCAVMSMMSDALVPAACEMDVMGALAMYALQLAGGSPSALFDWNNNYGKDPDRLILFHCSNCAVSLMREATVGYNVMAAAVRGVDESYCTLHGRLKSGNVAFARFRTDDAAGGISCCLGSGEITDDAPDTFGTTGVLQTADLPRLLFFLASHGFEHHVAVNYEADIEALHEALTGYMGWRVYHHNGEAQRHTFDW